MFGYEIYTYEGCLFSILSTNLTLVPGIPGLPREKNGAPGGAKFSTSRQILPHQKN